jgi:hypothetical protein
MPNSTVDGGELNEQFKDDNLHTTNNEVVGLHDGGKHTRNGKNGKSKKSRKSRKNGKKSRKSRKKNSKK